jgi:hypothetical protein
LFDQPIVLLSGEKHSRICRERSGFANCAHAMLVTILVIHVKDDN